MRDAEAILFDRTFEIFSRAKPEEVVRLILQTICEATGAEHGFVVLRGESGRLEIASSADVPVEAVGDVEADRGHQAYAFSRTIVREAIQTGRAVAIRDVLERADLAGSPSVGQLRLRSVLAVPLRVDGKIVGAVYTDRRTTPAEFDVAVVERFAGRIGAALRNADRLRELDALRAALAVRRFPGLVGNSPLLLKCLETALRAADTDATILIEGETGTGKELVAQGIHLNSARAKRRFVAVNCAALPENLLEGELFGWRRGAFTGAATDRAGKLAAADGGTLFLDEIGELPATLQAKLLRFLQNGEIQRLGADEPERVNVRVVAATNRRLEDGGFRPDLLFRLRVVSVRLPALRERREDIPLLAEHFLDRYARKHNRPAWQIDAKAMDALVARDYPGNVRELEHLVESAVVLATGGTISPGDLPVGPAARALPRTWEELRVAKDASARDLERLFLVEALRRNGGNVSRAAEETGADRTVLHQLMKKLGLDADAFRG